jgi:hypothetical protein
MSRSLIKISHSHQKVETLLTRRTKNGLCRINYFHRETVIKIWTVIKYLELLKIYIHNPKNYFSKYLPKICRMWQNQQNLSRMI